MFFYKYKILKLGSFFFVSILSYYLFNKHYLFTSIENQVDQRIIEIEKSTATEIFKFNHFDGTNANTTPIELGGIDDNDAYFSVQFSINNKKSINPQNLFQTASQNSGVRIEQIGNSLILIYSSTDNPSKYKGVVIEKELAPLVNYNIKVEALNQNFMRISSNGKIKIIISKDIYFKTNEFLIGGGFDNYRNYRGIIENIQLKRVNYKSSQNYLINKLRYIDLNKLFESIANLGLLLILPIFYILKKCTLKN